MTTVGRPPPRFPMNHTHALTAQITGGHRPRPACEEILARNRGHLEYGQYLRVAGTPTGGPLARQYRKTSRL
jgi:hypothetical protein